MPNLDLVPTSFRLLVNVDGEEADRIVMLGELRLNRRESVKLATGEDFDKLDGVLRLIKQDGEELDGEKPIGWLYYCGEISDDLSHHKASYQIDVQVPGRRFEALLTAVSQGRLPSYISIESEGMTYDWQPDGSGKIWDNKTSPQIPITSLCFITPLIGGDPHDFLDDRPAEEGMPPSRAQLNHVIFSLNELKNKLDSVQNHSFWLVILVVILLASLIWRYR